MTTEKISQQDIYAANASKQDGQALGASEWNALSSAAATAHQKINGVIDDVNAFESNMDSRLLEKQNVMEQVVERACSETDEVLTIETNDGNVIAQATPEGIRAKGFKDLNGREIGSNTDRKLILFEPSFYSVKKGRRNDANGVGLSWYDRFVICHISDTHNYYDLVKETIKVAQDKCGIIVNTGDDASGGVTTEQSQQVESLGGTKTAVLNSGNALPYVVTAGNHDVTNITKKQYYDIMGDLMENYSEDIVWGDAEHYRWYCYLDVQTQDGGTFRIIMLDPCDYDDGAFPSVRGDITVTFSQTQVDWLISTLLSAAENGYHVITAMHYSFGDNSLSFNEEKAKPDALFYQDPFMIPDIIDAIQHKTTLDKTYADSQNIQNITINRDFSNAGNLDYVCHLFGHIHSKNHYRCKKTDGSKTYDIVMLGEAALGTGGAALNKAYRYPGTVNDSACSFLAIDTNEKCIYRVAFGSYLKYDASSAERVTKISFNFNEQNQ